MLALAQLLVFVLEAYALVGVLFAVPFLLRGVASLDPGVAGAPAALRILLLPGSVAFWPLLAKRWWSGAHAPIERNPHRDNVVAR